jgi:uncharacterized protein involved in outer membrane biogenesis
MTRRILVSAAAFVLLASVVGGFVLRSMLANDRIKSTIEAQASAALGESVRIGTLDMRWFPRPGLTLGQVSVGETRTLTIGRLILSTGLRPLLSRHIAEAEVGVARSRLDAPRFFALLTRPVQSAGQQRSAGAQFTIDAVRSIRLRDVELTAGLRTIAVDADLSYALNRLNIERLEARSDITQLVAAGAISDLSRRTGRLTINATSLDLDGLVEFLAPFSGGDSAAAPTAKQEPFDITVEIAAKAGRAIGAAFGDLSAGCRAANGRLTLDRLRFSIFNGRFDGAVSVGTNAVPPRYQWRGALSGVDVARLVEFAGAPQTITGTLGARGSLAGAGTTVLDAFTRASGSAQIVIRDGRVPGLEVVRSVILAFGRPAAERPAGSGEEFTELSADLAISGGRAVTRNLKFTSRDVDMRGGGVIDLATQAINFDVDLVLSRELSAQAGRDLYRYASEGDRIVLPAKITGTASRPGVSIDMADALARAAKNKLRERAKSFLEGIIR